MGNKVIEPSEIIIDQPSESHEGSVSKANPWMRFVARFFDYALFFNLLHLFGKKFFALPYEQFIPIEYFAWIPVEAFLLWSWGTTPGKWLLGTEIKKGALRRLPWPIAFRRSFSVWFRGMGLGIPIINVICLISAYYRLRVFQTTSWDRDEQITVSHHVLPKWRFYIVFFLTAAGMIYYSYWKKFLF